MIYLLLIYLAGLGLALLASRLLSDYIPEDDIGAVVALNIVWPLTVPIWLGLLAINLMIRFIRGGKR